MTDNIITTHATGAISKVNRAIFSQIYSLDMQKELSTTLTLGAGGIFEDNDGQGDVDGVEVEARDSSIRPYIELQLSSQLLKGATSYRKNELKQSGLGRETSRRFLEEYNTNLQWKPVELPELDLYFSHNLGYNEPTSTEEKIDRVADSFQLLSRYRYQHFRFDYSHITTDSRNKVTGFDTLANSDNLAVRYNNHFQQEKYTFNGNIRIKRDNSEFTGTGARRIPTSVRGVSYYNLDDPPPATTNGIGDFIYGQPLSDVNLLQDGAPQLSVGLDYAIATDVDTVYIQLLPSTPLNNQASPGEVDTIKNLYTWSVYVSDDQLNWTNLAITQNTFDVFENRFEFSFISVRTFYVKIAVTPLPTTLIPTKEIRLAQLSSHRTLPADTSEFTLIDVTTDLGLIWKMSEKTSSGYDFLYREERTKPYNGKRSLLNLGARLNHTFNDIFLGNIRLMRSDVRERDRADRTGHTFSASLAANYLETFYQSLTYSFTHMNDQEDGTDSTQTFVLRNNLELYNGWSMNVDGGYTWLNPNNGENSNVTFARVGTNVTPNRWFNFSLFYDASLNKTATETVRRKHSLRLIANWSPYSTLSMTTDILVSKETGRTINSVNKQRYFINWSPFRGGTLLFTLSYGQIEDTEAEDSKVLSPALRWNINKKAFLTLDYSVGERENLLTKEEFETTRLHFRFFY